MVGAVAQSVHSQHVAGDLCIIATIIYIIARTIAITCWLLHDMTIGRPHPTSYSRCTEIREEE